MLRNVLIALAPVVIWSCIVNPMSSLRTYPIAIATCILCEFLFILITKKTPKAFTIENVSSAGITALIYSICLPTNLDWASGTGYFAVFAGAMLGIVLGKLVFGGIGNNIFNPAALGMILVRSFWGGSSSASEIGWTIMDATHVNTGATALTGINGTYSTINGYNLWDLILGRFPGSLGETLHIAILVGMLFLLFTKTIDWRVLVGYLGSFIGLMAIASLIVLQKTGVNPGTFMVYEIFSGGLLFGAVFMITDPVTGPVGSPNRWLFAIFGGMMAVFIRLFMGKEGVGYSILFANILAPVFNYPTWSSPKWKKWHWISLGVGLGVAILAVVLVCEFKEGLIK